MAASIKAVRGMNDVLPTQTPYWHVIEKALYQLAQQYGYSEIRLPIVESTALFKRSIGEVTDIVEKEMYTFEDRNGDSLTLRPEGTAGCVRAGIQNSLFYNQVQRLWYRGPMFRHERPQKGRYRQFYQFGLEAFGMQGPDIDVEHILFAKRLWQLLGLSEHIKLEINTLGTAETRAAYRTLLVSYFESHVDALDEDSKRRLSTNPLRILDSKNPAMQALNKNAPKMIAHLDEASAQEFKQLTTLLDALGVAYQVNPTLVRGLDYYSHTVYEWVTESLGAQGTVCAGGRYDALLQQLGEKKRVPAVGFALGIERLVLMLEQVTTCEDNPDVCMVLVGDDAVAKGLLLAEQLRDQLPTLGIECNLSAGSFKSQFKRADKSGARWALVIADDELTANTVTIKDLREGNPQQTIAHDAAAAFFKKLI